MKKSNECPKCGGREIYTDAGLSKRGDRSTVGISGWTRMFVDTYVCVTCGYLEEYAEEEFIKDSNKIEKLAKNWRKHLG